MFNSSAHITTYSRFADVCHRYMCLNPVTRILLRRIYRHIFEADCVTMRRGRWVELRYQDRWLPRNCQGRWWSLFQVPIKTHMVQSLRLLTSIDRLRQSVREIKPNRQYTRMWYLFYTSLSSNKLQRSLERAKKVKVDRNELTEEFIDARDGNDILRFIFLHPGKLYDSWRAYNVGRHLRHKWSEYCRSNMEWDWDTGSCLRNLFKIEKPLSAHGNTPLAAYDDASEQVQDMDLLQIEIGGARETMPEAIRVPYRDEHERKRYKTYYPAPESSIEYLPTTAEHPLSHMPNGSLTSSLENITFAPNTSWVSISSGPSQEEHSTTTPNNAIGTLASFDDLSEAFTNLISDALDERGLHDSPMDLDYEEGEDTQARISEGQSSDNRDVANGSNPDSKERGEQVQTAELVQNFDHNQYRDTDEVSYADSTTTYHTASSFRYKY